ncbi:MAG: DUF420 domain-containing protein [Acidobacteria bacterium]|nr:DUF420 domain-containing protein [Acidobacteriota bacterium]
MMSSHLSFWGLALILFASITASTLLGWREIRRGNVQRHRRLMNLAGALVGVFVLLYVGKVIFLGREDLSHWSPWDLAILRIHETFIAVMILSAGSARWIARRLGGPSDDARDRRRHRLLGRIGATSCLLAFLTALVVLRQLVVNAGP